MTYQWYWKYNFQVCSHYCDEFPQDILQELFEFEELSKSMETLVSVTDGVVHNASVIITIVFQLIQVGEIHVQTFF